MIDCYVGSTQPAMDRTFEVDATRSLVATQQDGTGSALSSSAVSTGGGGGKQTEPPSPLNRNSQSLFRN